MPADRFSNLTAEGENDMTPITAESWSLADAAVHLGKVVDQAIRVGPQVMTRDGGSAVVNVSAEDWERKSIRSGTLADFFAASPLPGSGLVLERPEELAPAIELWNLFSTRMSFRSGPNPGQIPVWSIGLPRLTKILLFSA